MMTFLIRLLLGLTKFFCSLFFEIAEIHLCTTSRKRNWPSKPNYHIGVPQRWYIFKKSFCMPTSKTTSTVNQVKLS